MKKNTCLLLMSFMVMGLTSCNIQEEKQLPMAISQEDWTSSKQFVNLSTGIKMAYVEMGNPDGEVVILQHGMTDNSRSWSMAAPFFCEAGYHVYLPDLRGMGLSDQPDGYYNAITYATDLEAFFDAMNIDKATLVGHSLGSYTVQAFSIMFPERCNKTVLVSSMPIKGYQDEAMRGLENKVNNLPDDGHLSDEFIDYWYATDLKEVDEFGNIFDEFIRGMKREAQALPKKAWKNIVFGFVSMNFTELYTYVDPSIKVLVLHGNEDSMTPLAYQDELKTIFNVDEDSYRDYEGIGHNIQFEIPRKCSTDIITWLKNGKLPVDEK